MINAIVYDIEIVKAIPGKGEAPIEGIEYCKGWHDHAGMGVSVIGVYDFVEDRFRVFCQDNFIEFFGLTANRKYLVSFNGVSFDNKVLNNQWTGLNDKWQMPVDGQYDLLQEIWSAYGQRFKGSGLDAMCEANGLGGKTGNGALAPVHWQQGKIGSVIDYCLQDVKLTRDLFLLSQRGNIKNPKGGELCLRKIEQ